MQNLFLLLFPAAYPATSTVVSFTTSNGQSISMIVPTNKLAKDGNATASNPFTVSITGFCWKNQAVNSLWTRYVFTYDQEGNFSGNTTDVGLVKDLTANPCRNSIWSPCSVWKVRTSYQCWGESKLYSNGQFRDCFCWWSQSVHHECYRDTRITYYRNY